MPIDVRPARRTDVPALAQVLGRAFREDPVMAWLQPDAGKRSAALPGFFGAVTRHHFLAGGGVEVAGSDSGVGAAALWDPPGHWGQQPREQIAMLPAVVRAFRGRLGVARALGDQMKAAHPEEPHWYLAMIGSDTAVRGGGYGNALMRSRLDRCDAEGAPAYLESSNPDNIGYYMRFGFEVTGEIVIPGGGPSLWPMWRRPR
ncbi:MAG: GNAT family N-acetyltransferase [Mycobacteriaceae bacterium]